MNVCLFLFFLLSAQGLTLKSIKVNDAFDDETVAQKIKHALDTDDQMDAELLDKPMVGIVPEMSPKDFHLLLGRDWSPWHAKMLYGSVTTVCMGFIAVTYRSRGFETVLAIMAFVLSLSLMSMTIRNIYVTEDFKHPQFVTCCHQICTALTAFAILQCRQATTGQKITYPTVSTMTTGLLPVALCVAFSLGTSNIALLYTTTHFYEMLCPTNSLFTFCVGAALGRRTSLKLLPPLLLVSVGLPIVAAGELNISFVGLFFIVVGIMFRSGKSLLQSLLMSNGGMSQTFDAVELSCWSSASTLVVMLIWSAISEGLGPWKAFWNVGVIVALLISCASAVVLNISALFVIKAVGPVAQQIIGELKGILASLGAVAAFGEVVTPQQIAAFTFVIIGVQWYNHTDLQVRQEEAEETQKLVDKQQSVKA